jgi:acid phosphatase family membrane protein YuiD
MVILQAIIAHYSTYVNLLKANNPILYHFVFKLIKEERLSFSEKMDNLSGWTFFPIVAGISQGIVVIWMAFSVTRFFLRELALAGSQLVYGSMDFSGFRTSDT